MKASQDARFILNCCPRRTLLPRCPQDYNRLSWITPRCMAQRVGHPGLEPRHTTKRMSVVDAPHTSPHLGLGKRAKFFFFLASVCENISPGIRYRDIFSECLYWRLVMLLYKGQNGRKRYLAKSLNKMTYINSGNPSDVKSHKKKGRSWRKATA